MEDIQRNICGNIIKIMMCNFRKKNNNRGSEKKTRVLLMISCTLTEVLPLAIYRLVTINTHQITRK